MRNSLWILFFASIALAFSSCSSSDSSSLVGNWSEGSSFQSYTRSGAVAFTIANEAYVGLGFNSTNYNYYTDFYKYNATSNTWTKVADFPGEGRIKAVAFVVNGIAYVGTGYQYNKTSGENTYYQDFYKYDPTANTWTKLANSYPVKCQGAVAFVVANTAYVGTGQAEDILSDGSKATRYMKDFYQFNPSDGSWSTNNDIAFPGNKRSDAVSFVINDKAYVVTGQNPSLCYDFYQFDPTLTGNKWVEKRKIKNVSSDSYDDDYSDIMRKYAVGFASATKGYVTCGQYSSYDNVTWEYDPTTDLWTKKTSFEGSYRTDAVSFVINGNPYVTTGASGSTFLDDTWEFKPNEEYDENL